MYIADTFLPQLQFFFFLFLIPTTWGHQTPPQIFLCQTKRIKGYSTDIIELISHFIKILDEFFLLILIQFIHIE